MMGAHAPAPSPLGGDIVEELATEQVRAVLAVLGTLWRCCIHDPSPPDLCCSVPPQPSNQMIAERIRARAPSAMRLVRHRDGWHAAGAVADVYIPRLSLAPCSRSARAATSAATHRPQCA